MPRRSSLLWNVHMIAMSIVLSFVLFSPAAFAEPSASEVQELANRLAAIQDEGNDPISDIDLELQKRPGHSVELAAAVLLSEDEKVSARAARILFTLSAMGDYSISKESLLKVIRVCKVVEDPEVKTFLMEAIAAAGPSMPECKAVIVDAIENNREPVINRAGIEALVKIAREEKPAEAAESTRIILNALKNANAPVVRRTAAESFVNFDADPQIVGPALIAALDDNYVSVRIPVVQALTRYRTYARNALSKIFELAKTETDESMRSSCLSCLSQACYDDGLATQFLSLLDDPEISGEALAYCQSLGKLSAPAIPRLVEFLKNADPLKRQQAANTLGGIGMPEGKDALPALKQALSDSDPNVRRAIADAIQRIETPPKLL